MGFKGLLFSFLGVGTITGTIITSYCALIPSKTTEQQSNLNPLKSQQQNNQREETSQPNSRALAPAIPIPQNQRTDKLSAEETRT